MDSLAQGARGQGQVLSISGKAGLGKTRLADEIMRLAAASSFDLLRGECPSYGANSSYLVWQPIWSDLFKLDTRRAVPELVATIEGKLAAIDRGLLPRLPLLGPLLQLEEENDLTRSLDAKLRKNALESLLVDCLAGFAQEKPLLILLDNCQWIDPLSRDSAATAVAQAAANLPVMLIHIQRPAELPGRNEFSLY